MVRMITIPQKRPTEVNMADPIKKFINDRYTTNLADYLRSADALNQLRNEALFQANGQVKLNKLMRYYDQLVAIEGKLPINETQIRILFKWYDAFAKTHSTSSSGMHERLCVLFNIGALASEIAGKQQFDQEDGLRTAIRFYQLALGAFMTVRDELLTSTRSDCTLDFCSETLTALISIIYAQAQEIFYMKAVRDELLERIVCKIAAKCSDFYAEAMKALQSDNCRDLARMCSTLVPGKQALYIGMAEFYRAAQAQKDCEYGEELARLAKSIELLKTAESRGGKEFQLKIQIEKITKAYEKAKKDNDFVYLARVPDHNSLRPIDRSELVKPKEIKLPISDDFRDLFVTLEPISVSQGLALFRSKREEALNLEIGKLRQATELLNTALAAWNLPAAIEDVAGSNQVPQSLLDKSQAIKDKGGINKINSMKVELSSLLTQQKGILNETKNILDDEERSDNNMRTQMKDKWTRTPSRQLNQSLYADIRQYETTIERAVSANSIVEDKYNQLRDGINLLSLAPNAIKSSLPSATSNRSFYNDYNLKELHRLMDDVDGLRSVRDVLESQLKTINSDATQAKLIHALQSSSGLDEHAIITNEIEILLATYRQQIRENIQEQERLLSFIERANSEFLKEKGQNETGKLRDEMLQNLAKASDGYNELYNHLQEAIKSLNILSPNLQKLQAFVGDFVFARKTEKDDLMRDIQTRIVQTRSFE